MVQFVFVHGVKGPRTNNPGDPGFQSYEVERAARDNNFNTTTFEGAATITDALWSIYAAHPAWNLACVPHAVLQSQAPALGGLAELALGGAPGGPAFDPSGTRLVAAARADLDGTLGALSVTALESASTDVARTQAQNFWAAAAKAAMRAEVKEALWTAPDDRTFLDRLTVAAELPAENRSLSLGSDLQDAWAKLSGGALDLVNSPAVLAIRNKLTPDIAIFIGDVFTYLKAGGPREQIRNAILTPLLASAKAAKAGGEKLVVCGHSMGGVILYDLLSDQSVIDHLSEGLGAKFEVDLLLTVGSQVALFEELKVFTSSSPEYGAAAPKPKMIPPPGALLWWNVFNRLDVLSFLAQPVFDGVVDLEASTIAGVQDAHGAYFTNMVFYAHLNERMKAAKIFP